jgi:putative ABC transport system permease protein
VCLYATFAYLIAQRTQEFGVRMALGASAASVMAMVAREGVALAGLGAALGIGAALAVSGVPAWRAARVDPTLALRND